MIGIYIYNAGICFSLIIIFFWIMAVVTESVNKNKEKRFFKYKSVLHYSKPTSINREKKIVAVIYGVMFILLALFLLFKMDVEHLDYCKIFLNSINDIEGIVLGYFGVVISVIIFSVTLGPKEYYLTVTRTELNKHYCIDYVYQIMVISVVLSIICTVLLQEFDLLFLIDWLWFLVFQISCILIVLCGAYALVVVGMMTIGRTRMELYSLNNLYKIFWNNSLLKLVSKTEDVIYENVGYLMNKYISHSMVKKTNMSKIKIIEYEDDISTNEKWYIRSLKVLNITMIVSFLVSSVFYIKDSAYFLLTINIILFLFGICLLNATKNKKQFRKYIISLVMDKSGYVVNMGKEEKFIGTVSIYRNLRLQTYINCIKNLMALYCILCACWDDKDKILESLEDMRDYIEESEDNRQGFEKALLYLPFFACGYFYFEKFGKEEYPKSIIKLFNEFKLNSEEANRYKKTLNSFVCDACKYRPSKEDKEAKRSGNWSWSYYKNYIVNNGYWQILSKK